MAYQKPEDQLVCDGERHFQGVQQEAELVWTRINLILKRAHEKIVRQELYAAAHLLEYAAALWSELTEKNEELMWRLWPNDFLKVRKVIGQGGSTADSPRFIESKRLGKKLWCPYRKTLNERSIKLLDVLSNDEDSDLRALTKSMMWYDYRVQEFNISHIYLVLGEIGDRTVGLKGGTVDYLLKRYEHYLFPELWDSVNSLYTNFKPD